ncbi:hypothetical protein A3Q56_01385 [Intoshia linei]|uniref:Uncharacterized protein n=1 Tax=Intoshia linei TaxID=1819745 RepID=A0A177B982_9BILA|nr:hypothetical protein A3Q56_01385 [Intoshia linei]
MDNLAPPDFTELCINVDNEEEFTLSPVVERLKCKANNRNRQKKNQIKNRLGVKKIIMHHKKKDPILKLKNIKTNVLLPKCGRFLCNYTPATNLGKGITVFVMQKYDGANRSLSPLINVRSKRENDYDLTRMNNRSYQNATPPNVYNKACSPVNFNGFGRNGDFQKRPQIGVQSYQSGHTQMHAQRPIKGFNGIASNGNTLSPIQYVDVLVDFGYRCVLIIQETSWTGHMQVSLKTPLKHRNTLEKYSGQYYHSEGTRSWPCKILNYHMPNETLIGIAASCGNLLGQDFSAGNFTAYFKEHRSMLKFGIEMEK